jgi:hypothetical protein
VPTFVFSQMLGINDNGLAVGYYGDSTTSQHGYLYNADTGMYTFVDDPAAQFHNGMEVTQITGISDSGEIAGFYTDANGIAHSFVANPVPEPGSLLPACFGLGVIGLSYVRRRRRAPGMFFRVLSPAMQLFLLVALVYNWRPAPVTRWRLAGALALDGQMVFAQALEVGANRILGFYDIHVFSTSVNFVKRMITLGSNITQEENFHDDFKTTSHHSRSRRFGDGNSIRRLRPSSGQPNVCLNYRQ